jgi:hypothetical protein
LTSSLPEPVAADAGPKKACSVAVPAPETWPISTPMAGVVAAPVRGAAAVLTVSDEIPAPLA